MIIQKNLQGDIIAKYNTKTEAAKALGLNESSIRRGIKYKRKVLGKYIFELSDPVIENKAVVLKSPAKILVLDIETSPVKAYTWGLWKQNIHIEQIISNWFCLTWAAKWLGSKDIMSDRLTPVEVFKEDDRRIIHKLWGLLDKAEIVIAHNGDSFDIPKINSRFIVNGLNPPSPYKQIDTLKIAKNQFGFSSNKLQALAKMFGYEEKFATTFDLWAKCMNGDDNALAYMEEYNKQDVLVLENIYLKLRPYSKGHPNLNLYVDEENITCPHCGSNELNIMDGKYFYTQAVKYNTYRCRNCGSISRSKTGIKYQFKKKISSIPK